MAEIFMTEGQKKAYEAVVKRCEPAVHITGAGGVGKSFLIHKIVDDLKKSGKVVLVGASTNSAAAELGGSTAHRIFGIPLNFAWKAAEKISIDDENPLWEADCVLIDEISMIRIDAFDFIARSVQYINAVRMGGPSDKKTLRKHKKSTRLQLVVVGDFAQLPPVVKDSRSSENQLTEKELLKRYYGDAFQSGYAFEAPGWKELNFKTYELLQVMRQENKDTAAALEKIRFGDRSGLDYFKRHTAKKQFPSNQAITLCGKNRTAGRINRDALDELEGKLHVFEAEESDEVEPSDRFAPQKVYLKVGCRVIFLASTDAYSKGDAGTVTAIDTSGKRITVDIDRRKDPVLVEMYTCTINRYIMKGKDVSLVVVGYYTQIPVSPAYAITIHKSQGQTYDRVNIMVGATPGGSKSGRSEIFAPGQLYVALSRARSVEGIYIKGNLDEVETLAAPGVVAFYGRSQKAEIPSVPKFPSGQPVLPAPEHAANSPASIEKRSGSRTKKKVLQKSKLKGKPKGMASVICPSGMASIVLLFAREFSAEASLQGDTVFLPVEFKAIVETYVDNLS